MIETVAQSRIWVATEPIDFRVGIDALAAACRRHLNADPFSGALFVFRNRPCTSIKVLAYDGQGFVLFQKRLSQGKFKFWPSADAPGVTLHACQLKLLLMGADPMRVNLAPNWRQLPLTAS